VIKYIETARQISTGLEKNWLADLKNINLYHIFEPIFKFNLNISDANILVCAIIFSYDKKSNWIDLKLDGATINKNTLEGLGADLSKQIFKDFIELSNEDIGDVVGAFLDIQSDWRFITIRRMIDFHAKTMMQKEPNYSNVDEEKKPKILENMSRTMKEGVFQREAADKLIEQIEKEYVNINHKTESDFGAKFTDVSTKSDVTSWREFIRKRNERKLISAQG
jgi:hypothetical protein